jgi:hypothetical protein
MISINEKLIPIVHDKKPSPFKQQENINFFLVACHEYGVPQPQIFREADLFKGMCFIKVIECLYTLATLASNTQKKDELTSFRSSSSSSSIPSLLPLEKVVLPQVYLFDFISFIFFFTLSIC